MKVLVACEFSGVVRDAFRLRGHDAWSCDILESLRCPDYHLHCRVEDVLQDGWDLMIAHPPCTYLCNGAQSNITRRPHLKVREKRETRR